MPQHRNFHFGRASMKLGAILLTATAASACLATDFVVTNLVSDGVVPAATIDAALVNPWGIASSPTSPFWIANEGTGTSTIYNSTGTKLPLTVTIPPPSNPTGMVYNGSDGFVVSDGSKSGPSRFLFANEGGTIAGWAPSVTTAQAFQGFDGTSLGGEGAIYKGLAIGTSGGASYLYAADFRNGLVEQLDSNFNLVRAFTDPTVKAGYAPFGAQVLNNQLFVTYALQDADKEDDVPGAGNGYVDVFSLDGTLLRQIVAQGGEIDSPWGLVIAPSSFGSFAGDLLVGNFGDGTISAFDLATGAFEGRLTDRDGNPLVLDDLWGLINGNGGNGGDTDKIYFTAGLDDETHGLFGSIRAVPEPATWGMALLGFGAIGGAMRKRRRTTITFA